MWHSVGIASRSLDASAFSRCAPSSVRVLDVCSLCSSARRRWTVSCEPLLASSASLALRPFCIPRVCACCVCCVCFCVLYCVCLFVGSQCPQLRDPLASSSMRFVASRACLRLGTRAVADSSTNSTQDTRAQHTTLTEQAEGHSGDQQQTAGHTQHTSAATSVSTSGKRNRKERGQQQQHTEEQQRERRDTLIRHGRPASIGSHESTNVCWSCPCLLRARRISWRSDGFFG